MSEQIETLKAEIQKLKEERDEREAAIPAHSVRAHQLIEIEDLEETIDEKEAELKRLLDA